MPEPETQTHEAFIAKTLDLMKLAERLHRGPFASYALGMLAGAACKSHRVFSQELLRRAFDCQTIREIDELDRAIENSLD